MFLGRVVQPGEPLWLEEDRSWAMALAELEADLCPNGCGQPLSESTAAGMDEAYDAKPIQCHACAARDRRMEGRNGHGELVTVTKAPVVM